MVHVVVLWGGQWAQGRERKGAGGRRAGGRGSGVGGGGGERDAPVRGAEPTRRLPAAAFGGARHGVDSRASGTVPTLGNARLSTASHKAECVIPKPKPSLTRTLPTWGRLVAPSQEQGRRSTSDTLLAFVLMRTSCCRRCILCLLRPAPTPSPHRPRRSTDFVCRPPPNPHASRLTPTPSPLQLEEGKWYPGKYLLGSKRRERKLEGARWGGGNYRRAAK